MKLKTTLCLTLLLTVLTVSPTFAQTVSSEKRLRDLSNRLNAFESNWNRFQIGGDLNLRSSTAWLYTPQTLKPLNFDQQLNLFLDTFFDRNISLSLKLAHNGEWGSKYYNQTYGSTPMATPLQLDEAFLRLQYPTSLNYLGRFRFSLSPLGLISDFYTIPVEGFSIQKTFRQFHVIGLYSRINTQYELAENSVKNIVAEDYWAARLGWSSRQHIIGINLVPDGVTYERNISVDWSYQWSGQKLIVEAAWYAFTPPDRSVYSVASGEDPGFLICYGKNLPKNSYFQLKGGYFGANFKPSYSSLSDTSGDEREWFVSNSYGVELLAQNQIRPGWSWENRVLFFKPLVLYAQSTDGYHFTSKIIKSFTPVNQAQLGVESKSINSATDNRIFASWNLRF